MDGPRTRSARGLRWSVWGVTLGTLAACTNEPASSADPSSSLYALVQGIDGVYFYPPLGPEPSPSGTFDATLLDGISVSLEAEATDGVIQPLATFDATTQPAVALLGPRERYWVNIPAAAYVTDPSKTYRIRVLLDGAELGASVLSAHVFTVLAYDPSLPIGVAVRVEGSGAVRQISRTRQMSHGAPAHCFDGRRNKDETGVDCGGSRCAPCCTPEVCDGVDNDCDGAVDQGNPGGGGSCSTGLRGACAIGMTMCTNGALTCTQTTAPTTEVCDGIDNDCDGIVDNGSGAYTWRCVFNSHVAITKTAEEGSISMLPYFSTANGISHEFDHINYMTPNVGYGLFRYYIYGRYQGTYSYVSCTRSQNCPAGGLP